MHFIHRATSWRTLRRVPLALLLAVTAVAVMAGPAAAVPLEPTMTTARLTELLAASPTGTVDGSFKTAVKGATIASVPCTIQGIVPQAAADNGDLILFKASGPVITEAGGIAAGMSGSPLYVNDGGVKLVGAVSYGEYFTNNGLGLATPIQHMVELESDFTIDALSLRLAKRAPLAEPVTVGGTTVGAVVVAPTTLAARTASAGAHAVVMRSLSTLMIGGMPAGTAAFRHFQSRLAAQGVDVKAGLAAGAAGTEPAFETPLVPGSSLGMLYMRGDFWYGGVGTTTYTTADDTLVGFGHPMSYDGQVSAYLTNADVIGLWNNAEESHKVVAPGKVRGTMTVDSGAGVAGVVGTLPAEVPFTCTATDTATGKTVTRTLYATQYDADQSKSPFWEVNALSFYPALYQATGDQQFNGHLEYTLTIVLSDGTHEYTVTRHNVWEDSYGFDAPFLSVVELAAMFSTLTNDVDGTIGMHVKAVDLDATLSPRLHRARVADVSVPGGLKTGLNTVQVKLYEYGSTTAKTVDVPLTIPAGMSTKGVVYAKAPYTNIESMGDGNYGWSTSYTENIAPPQTLADVVDSMNGAMGNDMLRVAYDPSSEGNQENWGEGEPWSDTAVTAEVDMGEYLTGSVSKQQAMLTLRQQGTATSGQSIQLYGTVETDGSDLEGQTVQIYKREVGETTDTLVATVPLVYAPYPGGGGGENEFVAHLPEGATHNARFTAAWGGDDDFLYTARSRDVKVQARVRLAATVKGSTVSLVSHVTPSDAGGTIRFLAGYRGHVRVVGAMRVSAAGTARCSFRAKSGRTRVMAELIGSVVNAGGASPVKSVTVK